MELFVLEAESIFDAYGEMTECGYIIGVYSNLELAEKAKAKCLESVKFRKSYDYTITPFTLDE